MVESYFFIMDFAIDKHIVLNLTEKGLIVWILKIFR